MLHTELEVVDVEFVTGVTPGHVCDRYCHPQRVPESPRCGPGQSEDTPAWQDFVAAVEQGFREALQGKG